MKNNNIIITSIFCIFIGGFFIINIILPDKTFSEMENRSLQQKPNFSIDFLISGEYTKKYETYVTDQFAFRDNFMEIKSSVERLLGKMENNGVYVSTENTLINKFGQPDYNQVDINLRYIQRFAQAVDIPVYFCLFPSQNDIYQYKLPQNAPIYSQKEVIDYAYDVYSGINVYDYLMDKNDEYIYYNTDHHWTSLGAYYAYQVMCETLGKTATSLDNLQKNTLSTQFNGTIYSSSGIRYAKEDVIDIYTENQQIEILDVNGTRFSDLYVMSKLDQKDQYEVFLGGNDPQVVIQGTGEGKLLIIKDSYTNSQVPFMLENYEEIHLIDLRFYKTSMSEYILDNEIDQVLVAQSVDNFVSDTNLIFLR